jgi:hypothetical protein
MNKLSIIMLLLVSACATEVQITPQPYTYIDCIRLGNPEQFCRDTATP